MPSNTQPIYTKVHDNGFAKVSGVDGDTDGTDADVQLVFTADATNGSFISKLIATPRSTSGSTTTSAAALRIYLNNGSTVATGTNNVLIGELTLPAIAVNVAGTTGVQSYHYPLNIGLAPGYRIYVGVTALAANTNWDIAAIGGKY